MAEYLWDWFWEAARGRQDGMNGPLALSAGELLSWASLTGAIVRPEEWAILRDMDGAYLAAVAEEQAEAAGNNQQGTPSGR